MSLTVWLYRVGRNLNRVYRTCEAFGVREIRLLECDPKLSGALFGAAGQVAVEPSDNWPSWEETVALETGFPLLLREVDWCRVEHLLLGGESCGLPKRQILAAQRTTIPQAGQISGLTVEAALAIALYDWRERCP